MQLWFPSSLEEPLSPTTRDSMTAQSTDPELEFDREVYPIGISIAEVAIIGQLLPKTPLLPRSPPPPSLTLSWPRPLHVMQKHTLWLARQSLHRGLCPSPLSAFVCNVSFFLVSCDLSDTFLSCTAA